MTEEFEKLARTTEYAIQRFKNQVVDIVSDAQETARAVVRVLNNQLRPAIRGIHVDTGVD
ncbi:hypothetical protein ACFO1V_03340 [Daeguia caeni]|uniref:Uncharacterized protein n=1 Tax=Daeguia caeni TaxID=439612 RepID=A0ABV9H3K8_9HYPH